MSSTPRISVILPFYNAAKTLFRALESIKNQSFENFECILIDNNSNDDSNLIASAFIKTDRRFRLINENKQGVVYASNSGYNVSKGEFICRMDADDWAFPDKLKLQFGFLTNNTYYDVVSGAIEYMAHHKKTLGFTRYAQWLNSVNTYEQILLKRFVESPIVNPSAMWRREISDTFGMYINGDFPEDYELWLRWLDAGVKITKVAEKVLKWYDSDTRLTRTDRRYNKKAFYEIKTKYLSKWLRENNRLHPAVLIWGANRISRQRAGLLEKYQIEIRGYIDISHKRKLEKELIFYKNIPAAGEAFILVYNSHDIARSEIQQYLQSSGYKEGENYLLVS